MLIYQKYPIKGIESLQPKFQQQKHELVYPIKGIESFYFQAW